MQNTKCKSGFLFNFSKIKWGPFTCMPMYHDNKKSPGSPKNEVTERHFVKYLFFS